MDESASNLLGSRMLPPETLTKPVYHINRSKTPRETYFHQGAGERFGKHVEKATEYHAGNIERKVTDMLQGWFNRVAKVVATFEAAGNELDVQLAHFYDHGRMGINRTLTWASDKAEKAMVKYFDAPIASIVTNTAKAPLVVGEAFEYYARQGVDWWASRKESAGVTNFGASVYWRERANQVVVNEMVAMAAQNGSVKNINEQEALSHLVGEKAREFDYYVRLAKMAEGRADKLMNESARFRDRATTMVSFQNGLRTVLRAQNQRYFLENLDPVSWSAYRHQERVRTLINQGMTTEQAEKQAAVLEGEA